MSRFFSLCCSANAVLEPVLVDRIISGKILDISNIENIASSEAVKTIENIASSEAVKNIENIASPEAVKTIEHLHLYDISMNIFEPN